MKKLLAIILSIVLVLGVTTSISTAGTINDEKQAYAIKATNAPVIDGKLDNEWSDVPVYDVKELSLNWLPNNKSTNTAEMRLMWDSKNLYVFAQVKDSKLSNKDKTQAFTQDSFEVLVDQANNKALTGTDGHAGIDGTKEIAGQFRVGAVDGLLSGAPEYAYDANALKDKTFNGKSVITNDGYDVEMVIPWTVLKDKVEDGTKIGFDAQINDDSGVGTRDGIIMWNKAECQSFRWTDYCGTVTLKTTNDEKQAYAVKATNALVIDGILDDEWSKAPVYNVKELSLNWLPNNKSTDTAKMRLMWDSKNLYVFAQVKDSKLSNKDKTQAFTQDSFEVLVDQANNKALTGTDGHAGIDGTKEIAGQFRVGAVDGLLSGAPEYAYDANALKNKTFKGKSVITTDGYDVEMVIPWTELKDKVEDGTKIGFDAQINDDSGVGTRDGIIMWNKAECQSFRWTDYCGTVILKTINEQKQAYAIKATNALVIDGKMDSEWSDAPVYNVKELSLNWLPNNKSTNTAKMRLMWDSKNLYVFAQVKDSKLSSKDKTQAFTQDSFEVLVDQGNNKALTGTDGHADIDGTKEIAGQFRIGAVDGLLSGAAEYAYDANALKNKTYKGKRVITTDGYDVEMVIPWTVLKGKVEAGTKIGFDAQINDDSGVGTRDGIIMWNKAECQSFRWTDYCGTVTLKTTNDEKEAYAVKATNALVIDGKMENGWSKAPVYNVKELSLNWLPNNKSTDTAKMRLMWDSKNLYVFAQVKDSKLSNKDKTQAFTQDSFEVLVDQANNKALTGTDGHADINGTKEIVGQFRVGAVDGLLSGAAEYAYDANALKNKTFKGKRVKTTDGYNVEMAIPWTVLKGKVKVGTKIGFDAQINDDSGVGTRNGIIMWNKAECQSFRWTDYCGTVILMN